MPMKMKTILYILILTNLFVVLGCSKPTDPHMLFLSKDKIKDITDRAYSTMMAQTDQGVLWKDRKTFTNYVLIMYYDKGVPMIEIYLTDNDIDPYKGSRFHICIYDVRTDTVIYKKGMYSEVK